MSEHFPILVPGAADAGSLAVEAAWDRSSIATVGFTQYLCGSSFDLSPASYESTLDGGSVVCAGFCFS